MMLLLLLIDISEPRNMSNKSSETETETVPVTVTYNNDVNTLTATVKIEDFKKKMKTWPSDKFIMSESFIVGSATGVVPLSLNIYPNGDEAEHEGNVSVYVMNDSNEKIQVNYTLKMKGNKVRQSEVDLKPEEGYGTYSLYCHKGVENLGSDEDTIISCTIRGGIQTHVSNITLASSIEAVQTSNDQLKSRVKDSTKELKRKYDSIETKVEEGNSDIAKRIARLESKLEASSESIKAKIDVSLAKNNDSVEKPKCPICFEEMFTKIAQCISGHLLCWHCKEKMGDKECAFCDQPVNGRCYGMEAYLRTIFG